ncbi:hypothetical protein MP228_000054 [Amoeboaphelidium protococcarum]|nr:hypothetical protein MP228_000054 [Amoeboaphelidium protococcarum]
MTEQLQGGGNRETLLEVNDNDAEFDYNSKYPRLSFRSSVLLARKSTLRKELLFLHNIYRCSDTNRLLQCFIQLMLIHPIFYFILTLCCGSLLFAVSPHVAMSTTTFPAVAFSIFMIYVAFIALLDPAAALIYASFELVFGIGFSWLFYHILIDEVTLGRGPVNTIPSYSYFLYAYFIAFGAVIMSLMLCYVCYLHFEVDHKGQTSSLRQSSWQQQQSTLNSNMYGVNKVQSSNISRDRQLLKRLNSRKLRSLVWKSYASPVLSLYLSYALMWKLPRFLSRFGAPARIISFFDRSELRLLLDESTQSQSSTNVEEQGDELDAVDIQESSIGGSNTSTLSPIASTSSSQNIQQQSQCDPLLNTSDLTFFEE